MPRQIHCVVWIPTRHPMTGEYSAVLQTYTDNLVTGEQADELKNLYTLRAAPGSSSLWMAPEGLPKD